MYAKNTLATAVITPLNPFGINDRTFSVFSGNQFEVSPFDNTK